MSKSVDPTVTLPSRESATSVIVPPVALSHACDGSATSVMDDDDFECGCATCRSQDEQEER